ncbi:MAG: bacillithiol biosynthesis cysteine-adding enzyme BshC [Rhodothermales bacterium]
MRRIPFSSFQSFSRLFSDYVHEPDKLESFFNGDFRLAADRAARAEAAASAHPDRKPLTHLLRKQAREWGILDASEPLILKLENPESVAVVTGQQLGLFGGPLYTLYKTLTTIQLASRMELETGRPVVPVFWLEGEDHDFEEIAWCGLFEGDTPKTITCPDDETQNGRAIGRRTLPEGIVGTLDELEGLLQPTEFRDDVMRLLREAYVPGRTFLSAFVQVMQAMTGTGRILFVSPDDPDLKRLGEQVFEHEINDWRGSHERLETVSSSLSTSWHAQVTSSPTNLFLHREDGRVAVDAGDQGLELRDGTPITEADLLDLLSRDPGSFSPNVVLRPLLQDAVLPTAAYVAGPGEVAYFAQFKPLYTWAHIPMPIIFPRASVSLVERRIEKVLDRYSLDVPDLEDQLDRLFRRVVLDNMDVDLDEVFSSAGKHLHEAVNAIKPVIEQMDPSLVKSAEAMRAQFMKEWSGLKNRLVKAERSRQDIVRDQLERAILSLVPDGTLQERFVSPVYFMNKYGPGFTQRLLDELELDTETHQVLSI